VQPESKKALPSFTSSPQEEGDSTENPLPDVKEAAGTNPPNYGLIGLIVGSVSGLITAIAVLVQGNLLVFFLFNIYISLTIIIN